MKSNRKEDINNSINKKDEQLYQNLLLRTIHNLRHNTNHKRYAIVLVNDYTYDNIRMFLATGFLYIEYLTMEMLKDYQQKTNK